MHPQMLCPGFELALTIKRNDASGAFILPDCYDYIPFMQLCVCYDKLGNTAAAEECNRRARAIKAQFPRLSAQQALFCLQTVKKAIKLARDLESPLYRNLY